MLQILTVPNAATVPTVRLYAEVSKPNDDCVESRLIDVVVPRDGDHWSSVATLVEFGMGEEWTVMSVWVPGLEDDEF